MRDVAATAGNDATTIETRTTTVVDPPPAGKGDGVIDEPGRLVTNILWIAAVLTLCASVVTLVAILALLAFTPADPPAAIDAATLVAVLSSILTGLLGLFVARPQR
jgi:hypothetical protein